MKPESDVELEPVVVEDGDPDDSNLPYWLLADYDPAAAVPALDLPPSSDDLVLPAWQALEAVTVYEVLRQYYKILRLSPFRFEDFCTVLAATDMSSNLLSEVHISLLKALLREPRGEGQLFRGLQGAEHRRAVQPRVAFRRLDH